MQIVSRYALLLDLSQQQSSNLLNSAATDGQFDSGQSDAGEQGIQIRCRELSIADAETKRVNACIQDFQSLSVSLCGALYADSLMYAPLVALAGATYVRELTDASAHKFDSLKVFGAVVGTYVETFVCTPYQFALIVSTFKVGCNHLFPLLGRYRREKIEQLFLGICHNY